MDVPFDALMSDEEAGFAASLADLYPYATPEERGVAAAAIAHLVEEAVSHAARRVGAARALAPAQDVLVSWLFDRRLDPDRVERFGDPEIPRTHPAFHVQLMQFQLESACGAPVEVWAGSEISDGAWDRFFTHLSLLEGWRDPDARNRLGALILTSADEAPIVDDDLETI